LEKRGKGDRKYLKCANNSKQKFATLKAFNLEYNEVRSYQSFDEKIGGSDASKEAFLNRIQVYIAKNNNYLFDKTIV
jgi:hypothetical protein